MKKIIFIVAAIALCVVLVFGGVMCAAQVENFNEQQPANPAAQALAHEQVSNTMPLIRGTIAPLSVSLTSATDEPGETQTGRLFAANGEEIMYIRETGQLITASGELIHTVSDNAMVRYDEVTQELLDSANRAMKIWFDSVSVQHRLQSGSGQTLTHIAASDMIYIATILDRNDGLTKTIYVTRKRYTTNWWDRLFGTQDGWYYKYYDMNGRHIPDDWFVEHNRAPWWRSALRVINGTLGIGKIGWWVGVFVGFEPLSSVVVTEAGTFGDITALLEFATWHPWDKLDGVLTANNDGVYNSGVYINPANRQLTDRLGAPIYHIETGLPFVIKDGVIMTIPNRQPQTVENGILQNGATRHYLRNLGFEEYIHYIDDAEFGIIGVLVLAVKDEGGRLIKWVLPNGDDAEGIVRDNIGIDTDGEEFTWAGFWDMFGGVVAGVGGVILGIVIIVVIVLLLIYAGPIVMPIFKFIWKVITAPFRWLGKQGKKMQEKAAEQQRGNKGG